MLEWTRPQRDPWEARLSDVIYRRRLPLARKIDCGLKLAWLGRTNLAGLADLGRPRLRQKAWAWAERRLTMPGSW